MRNARVMIIGRLSRMGLALARLLAAKSAAPILAGRSPERLATAAAAIGGAETLAFDAGDPEASRDAFAAVGPLDHVVTTAAELADAPVADLPLAVVETMLRARTRAPFLAARHAAPRLNPGGSLLFFSGLAAYRPAPGTAVAAGVNAALEGLAKALAVELAPIRVNALSPGMVDAPGCDFMEPAERGAFLERPADSLPVRRVGRPEEAAAAALALLSNPFVTGAVLHVDGGGRLR